MKCLYPILITPTCNSTGEIYPPIYVPCGHCMQCRLQSSLAWSVRAQFEDCYCKCSCFLTLTYADTPKTKRGEPTLCKKHLQAFLKRLRVELQRKRLGHIRSFFLVANMALSVVGRIIM